MSSRIFSPRASSFIYGLLVFLFILLLSQTASSDKVDNQAQQVLIEETKSYSEARKEDVSTIEITLPPPEDRMCDNLDEIIEILREEGIESE